MDWELLLSAKRLGAEDQASPTRPGRSEFASDIDRIIFSSAFRRLGKKTQVHPLAANDHVHTRLTHSLEVARVGMALGRALASRLLEGRDKYEKKLPANVNADDLGNIVQAACLAHDLGNPPFGHAGEDAIIHWFEQNRAKLPNALKQDIRRDLSAFEGNAQGFRIVTQLENHIFQGGLRLTYATLGTFQKYPTTSRKGCEDFGAYISEEDILSRVFSELGIGRLDNDSWCRHPLAFLVEAADDICYAIIDIEDAVELGIISFDEAKLLLFVAFSSGERAEVESLLASGAMHRVNFARLRGRVFDKVISGAIDPFMENYDSIMAGKFQTHLFKLLPSSDPRRKLIEDAKEMGQKIIYNDQKKVEIEIGCYSVFDALLSAFCGAARDQAHVLNDNPKQSQVSWRSERILKLLGDHAPSKNNAPPGGWTHYQCQRRAIDFISGMTDNYAIYIARQLQGAGFSGGQRP